MSNIDLNKPHVTLYRDPKNGKWAVTYPQGNLICGADNFESYGKALSYAHFIAADFKLPLHHAR